MALTQSQLVRAAAERADLSKNDAKRARAALEEVMLEEIGNAQKVRPRHAADRTLKACAAGA
jgi:nucleoid DNA-binding protein